jgi:hypothetical protein
MTSPAPKPPAAITTLTKRLAPGWAHHITGPRTGTIVLGGLSEATDGEGRRRRVEREVSVTSYMLAGCHHATGRHFRAVWVQQAGTSSWKLDIAVRGAHRDQPCTGCMTGGCGTTPDASIHPPCATCLEGGCGRGEHAPQHLDAGQLTCYASSASVLDYEAQLRQLAAKREETKRKAAATRAARRATDISGSVPTEVAA